MTERHIVAMGGGALDADDAVFRHVMDLTGASAPRVCYLATATGDDPASIVNFYRAFPAPRFRPTHLPLFDRSGDPIDEILLDQDAVVVAGGNTANLLAIWRLHGVDEALRAAWHAGVVLCGASAGANCWFEASTTDSFGPTLHPLDDGLAFLPGSFSPHYDSEDQRRPLFQRLIASGFLEGYAADDFAAAHFVGTGLAGAIASRESAHVYRVERPSDGTVTETVIAKSSEHGP